VADNGECELGEEYLVTM